MLADDETVFVALEVVADVARTALVEFRELCGSEDERLKHTQLLTNKDISGWYDALKKFFDGKR